MGPGAERCRNCTRLRSDPTVDIPVRPARSGSGRSAARNRAGGTGSDVADQRYRSNATLAAQWRTGLAEVFTWLGAVSKSCRADDRQLAERAGLPRETV